MHTTQLIVCETVVGLAIGSWLCSGSCDSGFENTNLATGMQQLCSMHLNKRVSTRTEQRLSIILARLHKQPMLHTWSVQCSVYILLLYVHVAGLVRVCVFSVICSCCHILVSISTYTGSPVDCKVTERAACPGIVTYSQSFSAGNRELILCEECLGIG